jgi:hypothetical protein
METKRWLSESAHRRITDQEIASILGVTRKTANKRLNEGLSSDDLIRLCDELGINQTLALVELGRLTHEDVLEYLDSEGQLLETADDAALVLELARRMVPKSKILEQTVRQTSIGNKPGARKSQRESPTSVSAADDFDDDVIIARINAGVEQVAAQETTPPIEEHFT